MGRAQHPRLGVGEQDWAAISGDDAEHDARRRGHHRIGDRSALGSIVPGCRYHDHIGRMDLMRRGKLPAGTDRIGRRSAQPPHRRRIARPAEAELVRAARAAEEAVRHAVQQRMALDLEVRHLRHQGCG